MHMGSTGGSSGVTKNKSNKMKKKRHKVTKEMRMGHWEELQEDSGRCA